MRQQSGQEFLPALFFVPLLWLFWQELLLAYFSNPFRFLLNLR
jgi:hypothetical protein